MCDLCSDDPKERESARKNLERTAARMEEFARLQRSMARGFVKPHGKEVEGTKLSARSIIYDLVEGGWL